MADAMGEVERQETVILRVRAVRAAEWLHQVNPLTHLGLLSELMLMPIIYQRVIT